MRLDSIRELVRSGRLAEARHAIGDIDPKRLARERRADLAFLCIDAQLPRTALAVLHPIVRPREGRASTATPDEKAEYARALTQLGLTSEAKVLLKETDLIRFPAAAEALLGVLFREWDWSQAIPVVDSLLASPKLKESERLIQRLNYALSLAYGEERNPEALELLEKILEDIGDDTSRYAPLRYMVLANLGLILAAEGEWSESARCLDLAEGVNRGEATALAIHLNRMRRSFLEFGQAVERGQKSRARSARSAIQATQAYFVENHVFWFARTCDYYRGLLGRDPRPLLDLYFGSSHPGAMARAKVGLQKLGVEPPRTHSFLLSSEAAHAPALDLMAKDQWKASGAPPLRLKPGQLPYRLMSFFACERYYRPSVSGLHSIAYPGEHYHPRTSPLRVGNGLIRLRKELRASRLPALIQSRGDRYWLEALKPISVILREADAFAGSVSARGVLETRVRAEFGDHAFSAPEFARRFSVSERQAQYKLKEACEQGWLVRTGLGRATRFQLRQAGY